MWQVYENKNGVFEILESETGELLHTVGAGVWRHTNKAVAERVANKANEVRYVPPTWRLSSN